MTLNVVHQNKCLLKLDYCDRIEFNSVANRSHILHHKYSQSRALVSRLHKSQTRSLSNNKNYDFRLKFTILYYRFYRWQNVYNNKNETRAPISQKHHQSNECLRLDKCEEYFT